MNKRKWAFVIVAAILAVVVAAWGIVGAFSARAATWPAVQGTYTLKGNVAIYGEDGKRLRDAFDKVVPCKTGTLVILTQLDSVITGTLTLQNIDSAAVFAVTGWVGETSKTATLSVWGDSAGEPTTDLVMVLRGRVKTDRNGVVTGLGYIKIQGTNLDALDYYIFEGRMVCREYLAPE